MIHTINWQNLTEEKFLNEYWQKKPLLIKNAFENFKDPIEADELAGLAMEEFIESRIISNKADWQVSHGPFSDFSTFGESHWTLLVQAVNHWSKDTQSLLTPFKFIPNWRIDDVMVSFSTPQAGVGPHLDQYDVFIIQGLGKRHWQVGKPDSTLVEHCPHEDLKQVSKFKACIDTVTEPGDLLYIPPNHPHNGYALENSLNYSIGFQAPNTKELIGGLADFIIDNELGEQRLCDLDREATSSPHLLTNKDVAALRNMILDDVNDPAKFNAFIGKYLTTSHHQLNIWTPESELSCEQISEILTEHDIEPVLGMKKLVIEQPETALFINGERLVLTAQTLELGNLLAQDRILTKEKLKSFLSCLKNTQLLTSVLNMGLWNLVE